VLIIKNPILSVVMIAVSFGFLIGVAVTAPILKSLVCTDLAVVNKEVTAQVKWELNEDGSVKSGLAWPIVK